MHSKSGEQPTEELPAFVWLNRLLRPKGNLEPPVLAALIFFACAPFVLVLARSASLPGNTPFFLLDLDILRNLGAFMNQTFTFEWVPPGDRGTILYLLLLPLGAVLMALARLTFGLRILGFRAILIGIGFQQVGVLPSLLLLAAVIGVILVIRPPMRRIRLPLFARVSVILCVTAMIMVAALLLAPIVRSEVLWSVAFFPVIIVAMLAEGIARSIQNDSPVTAAWRATWTIIVALIFASISTLPFVRHCALYFPELMLTQLISIIFISEFLDYRLLQRWPDRISRYLEGARDWTPEKPIVAVVRNRWNRNVIGRLGRPAPAHYRKRSVRLVVDALRDEGFKVKVIEGDTTLLKELKRLIPPEPGSGDPGGIVLNMASGVQGNGRFCQIPAMLELAGVPYSGPDALGQANLLDRYVLLSLLRDSGLPVPRFLLATASDTEIDALNFPVSVRHRADPDLRSIRAKNGSELDAAVDSIRQLSDRSAMLEERTAGREIRVSVIGNQSLECLPLMDMGTSRKSGRTCPARIDDSVADRIREIAYQAFQASGCRDYARIDVRLSEDEDITIVGVNWDGILARRGSFIRSAQAAGYSYAQVIHRIIDTASMRYGDRPLAADLEPGEPTEFSTWLPGKRVEAL